MPPVSTDTVRFKAASLLLSLFMVAVSARANSWTGGSGKWETATNWSLGFAPSISDNVDMITTATNQVVSIDATTAGSCPATMMISNVLLNASTLQLADAIATPFHILNAFTLTSAATLVITNSAVQFDGAGGLAIGTSATSPCAVWMLDGLLVGTNWVGSAAFPITVGKGGIGTMAVSNGTVQTWQLNVADSPSSQGTLTINGGTLQTFGWGMNVGGYAGDNTGSTGTVWITGGELITDGPVSLGFYHGAGSVIVSNGTWSDPFDIAIGSMLGGVGTLTIAGGTVSVGCGVEVGYSRGGKSGALWLTGGQLSVTGSGIIVGLGCMGQMTVSNGTLIANNITIGTNGPARGVLDVVGGTVIVGGQTLSNGLYVGYGSGATGNVNIIGGQLLGTNTTVEVGTGGTGHLTIGTSNVAPHMAYASLGASADAANEGSLFKAMNVGVQAGSSGTLTMLDAGTLTVSSNLLIGDCRGSGIGSVEISGGSLFVTNGSGAASVDVRHGQLVLSNGVLKADTLVMTNSCGRLIHAGGSLIVGRLVLDPNTFQIVSMVPQGNDMFITLMLGPGATNALQAATPDASGNWSTNGFSDIFIVTNNAVPGTVTNYLDLGAITNTPARYYRVRLAP